MLAALLKVGLLGATGIGGSILAAANNSPTLAIGTTLTVVVGFAGVLIQQVIKNQRTVWAIVRQKDFDNEGLRDDLHFAFWRIGVLQFRLQEGPDPGPFVPRTRHSLNRESDSE